MDFESGFCPDPIRPKQPDPQLHSDWSNTLLGKNSCADWSKQIISNAFTRFVLSERDSRALYVQELFANFHSTFTKKNGLLGHTGLCWCKPIRNLLRSFCRSRKMPIGKEFANI